MQLAERNDSPRKVEYHLRLSTVQQYTDFHKLLMTVPCEHSPEGIVTGNKAGLYNNKLFIFLFRTLLVSGLKEITLKDILETSLPPYHRVEL